MIDFSQFVSWAFYGLISFAFYRIDKNLTDVNSGVETLNLTLAVEVQKNHAIRDDICELRQKSKEMNHRLVAVEVGVASCGNKCKHRNFELNNQNDA